MIKRGCIKCQLKNTQTGFGIYGSVYYQSLPEYIVLYTLSIKIFISLFSSADYTYLDYEPFNVVKWNILQVLAAVWGNSFQFMGLQPLRLVNRYFGPEIAFHFAWLGYSSCFLIILVLLVLLMYLVPSEFAMDNLMYVICKST